MVLAAASCPRWPSGFVNIGSIEITMPGVSTVPIPGEGIVTPVNIRSRRWTLEVFVTNDKCPFGRVQAIRIEVTVAAFESAASGIWRLFFIRLAWFPESPVLLVREGMRILNPSESGRGLGASLTQTPLSTSHSNVVCMMASCWRHSSFLSDIRPERPDVSPAVRCRSHRCEVTS